MMMMMVSYDLCKGKLSSNQFRASTAYMMIILMTEKDNDNDEKDDDVDDGESLPGLRQVLLRPA